MSDTTLPPAFVAGRAPARVTRSGARAPVHSLHGALTGPPPTSAAEAYAGAAEAYGLLHWLWLRLAGGRAERSLLRAVDGLVPEGGEVLDAGCGTGRLSRRIGSQAPPARLTLLDASAAMLARADDVRGRRVLGDLCELPFPDERFGLVVIAWVLEIVPDPNAALREGARVLAPGGHLAYCYSTLPATALRRAVSAPLRRVVTTRFAGSFLTAEPELPGQCELVSRPCPESGLAAAAVLRKRLTPAP